MATVPRFTGKGLYKTGVSNQRLVLNNANRLLNRHLLRRQFIKVSDDTKLDFSDVLITPRRSGLKSRSEAVLEREVYFVNSDQTWKGVPIAVANMDTTGTIEMARELQKSKMLTCLHKYYSHQDIPDDLDTDYFAI